MIDVAITIVVDTVTASGLNAFNNVAIDDTATGTSVTFNDSGLHTYSDSFQIDLDESGAGSIVFNGATNFIGSAALDASTTGNILVNTGATVTTVDSPSS